MIQLKSKIISRLRKLFPKSKLRRKNLCPICSHESREFIPIDSFYREQSEKYGFPYGLDKFETLEIDYYGCPNCCASDRCRLMALFLQNFLWNKPKLKTLDIAPSPALGKWLSAHPSIDYRSCDLYMENVDDKVDITDMHLYSDNHFDLFICSHVLEHVNDDKKAMSELYRVLKPGGTGLVLVPICLTIKEIKEDPDCPSNEERWRHFGQNDHVRLYNREGFIERLETTGFQVERLDITCFPNFSFYEHGIDSKSALYVVKKPLSA